MADIYCAKTADMGEGGDKNGENFADVFYVWPFYRDLVRNFKLLVPTNLILTSLNHTFKAIFDFQGIIPHKSY